MIQVRLTTPNADAMNGAVFVNRLRHHSEEIAALLMERIKDRTPVDTGALRESLEYQAYTGDVTGVRESSLVKFYFDPAPQDAEWHRVYDTYQEGPPLGLSTYTNPPRQMLARIQTDDYDLVSQWVDETMNGEDFAWEEEETVYGDA